MYNLSNYNISTKPSKKSKKKHAQEVHDERQNGFQQNNYFMPHHATVRDNKVTKAN